MTRLFCRRTLPVALLSFMLLTAVGCASWHDKIEPVGQAGGPDVCSGSPSPYAPIVCVDDSLKTLPTDPETIHVINLPHGKRPTVLNWFTVSGTNNLSVTFNQGNAGCFVKSPECHGSHCMAVIYQDAAVHLQCKYTVKLLNKRDYINDPVVEIDACCPSP